MKIDVLTLFPEMFQSLEHSIIGKAVEKNIVSINTVNFRAFANNKQNHVDDYTFGGGAGMLLKVEPVVLALESVVNFPVDKTKTRIVLLDPAGVKFSHQVAEDLSHAEHLVFVCGHYEGYDERIKSFVTDEISLGDYVLTGGELASMVMIDATVRLLPDVLGNAVSAQTDSHAQGLLEHPQYTRPREFRGMTVPDVLLSGNHQKIEEWRLYESLKKTYRKRPDLLSGRALSALEEKLLMQIKEELNKEVTDEI